MMTTSCCCVRVAVVMAPSALLHRQLKLVRQLQRQYVELWVEVVREVYPDGPTEEDLASIPLRRLGTTREVGDVVAFLCSERASYVSGIVVLVDGALTRGL